MTNLVAPQLFVKSMYHHARLHVASLYDYPCYILTSCESFKMVKSISRKTAVKEEKCSGATRFQTILRRNLGPAANC